MRSRPLAAARSLLGLVWLSVASLPAAGAPGEVAPVPSHGVLPGGAPVSDRNLGGSVLVRDTYSGSISRLLQARCQTCHHRGGIAPFSLETWADVAPRVGLIWEAVTSRKMPPWHVDNSCARFEGDRSLSDAEVAAIDRWVRDGAPGGNPISLPAPLTFADGWKGGDPDRVLAMRETYTPSFARGDDYRCFVVPTSETADRWVTGVEVAPGSQATVHHVLLFIDTQGQAAQLDARESGPGYTCFGGPGFSFSSSSLSSVSLGGWAPGSPPLTLPEGVGILLPKGATVVMQVHYSAHGGAPEPDVTSVGLRFARTPVKKRFLIAPVINQSFRIPAGASNHEVRASIPLLPADVHVLAVAPHMHLLGRTMRVEATTPSGAKLCLVNVPDWDFHWQGTYFYEEPIALPALSRVDLVATYDNSSANPENPNDPPKDVTWGEGTTDEMCIAFLGFTLDYENLN